MRNRMDLSLAYTKIQKLLLNNEEVILPNVGIFRIESTPASFLQDGKTILPPSKKLIFENKIIHGARLPWQEDLGAKIVETLAQEESFEVPGFGIFTKTEQGGITFTANESFDFAPDNFSLEAIQLEINERPLQVTAQEEETSADATTSQPEETREIPHEEPAKEPVKTTVPPSKHVMEEWQAPQWIKYAAVAIGVIVLLSVLAIIFKDQLRPLLENILYTEEELEIIKKWGAQ